MKLALICALLVMVASASAVEPCRANQLQPTMDGGVAAGHVQVSIFLKNISKRSCTLKGYPHLIFFNKKNGVMVAPLTRAWPMGTEFPPSATKEQMRPPEANTVLLLRGAEAEFEEHYADETGVEKPGKNCKSVQYSELELASREPRLRLQTRFRFCFGMSVTSIRNAWNSETSRHLIPGP